MIIDTHTHIDHEKYFDDFDEMMARARTHGVTEFIIPAADPSDLARAISLSEEHDDIYFSVGVHPLEVQKYDKKYLLDHIHHPKCIAVGEIGLDYYYSKETMQRQKEIFHEQIEIAVEYDKPIIVHIRDASRDSEEILEAHPSVKGVLHCYNADEELLKLRERFYYGIGGVLTFKNAKKLINVFPKIPRERVILETDAPYLTPHPHRGKRNEPYYTIFVADKVAELWECERAEVEEVTTRNAKALFSL